MKNQKKLTILLGSILGVLVLTLGITFAVFTYQQTGANNQQLVLGDIYMHYNETNQLKMENAMPTKGIQKLVTGYLVNPIMATQDASDTSTELYACINLFQNEWGYGLDEGEDFESFCRGTGTNRGWTLQMILDDGFFENELLSLNIIQEETIEYTNIKLNPEIATQTAEYENELTACVSYFNTMGITEVLDEGSTDVTFCQGTGTVQGGTTIQTLIESAPDENIQEMFSLGILTQDGESYVVNPDMANQTVGEINELMTCVSLVTLNGYEFDEGTTAESFCKGEGTVWEGITLKKEFEDNSDDIEYMMAIGSRLLENNIILTERNLPYFEFTISGKNTYKEKDIYFDVLLTHGNTPENKLEENRIEDGFLRFALYEVLDDNTEKNIFLNKNYSSLENKRIHVETIPKNTTEEINKTYRLYMWIDNDVVIGNINQDYTTEEWKGVFASIKVSVTGDFDEKELDYEDRYNITDESCFTTTVETNEVTITDYDPGCGSDVVIPETINGNNVTTIGDSAFYYNKLASVVMPDTVTTIGKYAFSSNYLTSIVIPDGVTTIGHSAFYYNKLTSVVMPDTVTSIGNSAFSFNDLTSIVIPDGVTTIGDSAFYYNKLTSVVMPDTVTSIGNSAFESNKLTNVVIGQSVTTIGNSAFLISIYGYVEQGNQDLESIINKSGNAFDWKNIISGTTGDETTTFEFGTYNYGSGVVEIVSE